MIVIAAEKMSLILLVGRKMDERGRVKAREGRKVDQTMVLSWSVC